MFITKTIREFLEKKGYRVFNQENLPTGIDLALDLQRIPQTPDLQIIFDIGANEGQTVFAMRKQFPQAKIHAFEPVAETFSRLKENTKNLPDLITENIALGDTTRTQEIALHKNSHINSLRSIKPSNDNTKTESISVVTLDEYCSKNGIKKIDLLKIDTEGFEIEVCKGAAKTLKEATIPFILAEVDFRNERSGHTPYCELSQYLAPYGFKTHAFYDISHSPDDPRDINYCNVLFARNSS
ncbi:FkbM family methyltransferase [Rubellicoccus peritrichatus]|uniref:FkbM family methyltransferase n=1 Tax=Rubellicoccus peritrichatus TaxID=3080537 RepID=A0AAQ3L8H8_9BACT|nr:FkbM family methyltransferase [Puniceicoccus sp. CR14]WOO40811.1 FkbM family methyltransferase [Puniceicoccus sp. CR14]